MLFGILFIITMRVCSLEGLITTYLPLPEMEQGQYDVMMAERAAKSQQTGRNPRGRVPKPPL